MYFIEYPKCSTCKKAKKYLEDQKLKYQPRNIVTETPTKTELTEWVNKYNIPVKKLFNTSGIKYRELNLKEKLLHMTESEKLEILSSDGMLIKRPLLVLEDDILIGFNQSEWKKRLEERK